MSGELLPKDSRNIRLGRYANVEEIDKALLWAISDLGGSSDNPTSFEMLREVLKQQPGLVVNLVTGSVVTARENLGQERENDPPSIMLGAIDAAIKVIGHQKGLFPGDDAFSPNNWTVETLIHVLSQYGNELIELAGNNTTSKNIPHRASYMLWLIDQCPSIPHNPTFAFVELGASGGLILDALKRPHQFALWMKTKGYETSSAHKFSSRDLNVTIGVDLVIPSTDWLKALILTDSDREEIIEFINQFERSIVIKGDVTQLHYLGPVMTYLDYNRNKTPFIFSTSTFYQLTPAQRETTITSARSILQSLGGGYILIADMGKNRGYPGIERNVAWIENERGEVLTPRIKTVNQNGTKWELI